MHITHICRACIFCPNCVHLLKKDIYWFEFVLKRNSWQQRIEKNVTPGRAIKGFLVVRLFNTTNFFCASIIFLPSNLSNAIRYWRWHSEKDKRKSNAFLHIYISVRQIRFQTWHNDRFKNKSNFHNDFISLWPTNFIVRVLLHIIISTSKKSFRFHSTDKLIQGDPKIMFIYIL